MGKLFGNRIVSYIKKGGDGEYKVIIHYTGNKELFVKSV
jgi:hypothetical protein